MNILVIGGGGREHALVWKLKQSRGVDKIYCCPGNGGIGQDAVLLPACAEGDWESYAALAHEKKIDLTVVGPEVPLAGGIVDVFKEKGLKIFGPSQKCAMLEASKAHAKEFMRKHGLPTAEYAVFDDAPKAFDFIARTANREPRTGMVVKADGLAAGKGVTVCKTQGEANKAVEDILVKKVFGGSGAKVVVEEALMGEEVSLMALCDGKTILPLTTARDYKRVFDGNLGPNTGGMGAVAPSPVPAEIMKRVQKEILERFLEGVRKDKLDYRGLIYFGLMLTPKGPVVLEFNVRFGDPETEVILPLIKSDLAQAFLAVCDQKLRGADLKFSREHCVTVVCASGGYPDKYQNHKEITRLEANSKDAMIFHSGTVQEGGKFFTQGGRVLNCVGKGKTFEEAKAKAYQLVSKIHFEGMHYRKDIGDSNADRR